LTRQVVNVGNDPNDGTGTPLRDAMIIINDNFLELYTNSVVNSSITVGNSSVNTVINSTSMVFSNNSSVIRIGNTTVNAVANSSGFYTGNGNVVANSISVYSNTINVGAYTAAANGYTYLPNGFKMNYGYVFANSSIGNATFSSGFGSACYVVTATSNTASPTYTPAVLETNTTVAVIRTSNTTAVNVFYMAIGR
jgi:hypothetical protein